MALGLAISLSVLHSYCKIRQTMVVPNILILHKPLISVIISCFYIVFWHWLWPFPELFSRLCILVDGVQGSVGYLWANYIFVWTTLMSTPMHLLFSSRPLLILGNVLTAFKNHLCQTSCQMFRHFKWLNKLIKYQFKFFFRSCNVDANGLHVCTLKSFISSPTHT